MTSLRDRYRPLLIASLDALANGAVVGIAVGVTSAGTGTAVVDALRPAVLLATWRFLAVLDRESEIVSVPGWVQEMDPREGGTSKDRLLRLGAFVKVR